MLFRYFMPPDGSAGKNFTSRQPSSKAVSTSLGSDDARCKGKADLLGRLDNTRIEAGSHAKLSMGLGDFANLGRCENRANAGEHLGNFRADRTQCPQCGRSSQGQLHDVDAACHERSSKRNGMLHLVNDQHSDHTARFNATENFTGDLRIHGNLLLEACGEP